MIDFQNQTLTAKPLKEIINMTVLFRREETLDKFRHYKQQLQLYDQENETLLSEFSSWVSVLYEQNRSMLIEEWDGIKQDPVQYATVEALEKDINSSDEQKIIDAFRFLDQFIYSKGITKSDTRENVETRSIIKRNKMAGL